MEKNIKENIQDLPQVILTNGKPVDPSIIHSPDTIPAGAPLVSTLPKLEWKELDNSKVVAKTPVTIKINNPDTITIKKPPFNSGEVLPQSILCASPEIVQVKNPFIPEKKPFQLLIFKCFARIETQLDKGHGARCKGEFMAGNRRRAHQV